MLLATWRGILNDAYQAYGYHTPFLCIMDAVAYVSVIDRYADLTIAIWSQAC